MTTLTNSFEGITPSGTAVSTGNSGGVSGNAFDAVTIGTSATVASDSTHAAHGSLGCQIATAGTATTAFVAWTTSMGSQTTVWFRMYLYITGNPANVLRMFSALQGATAVGSVTLTTTGLIRQLNAAGATIQTGAVAVPANQWVRLEGFITGDATNGQIETKLYKSADSTTADETLTSTANQAMTGPPSVYRYGNATNIASVGPYWLDDIGLSNTGYLGPFATAPVPAVAAWPGQTWLRRFHHQQNPIPFNQHFVNILPGSVTTTGTVTDLVEPVYTGSVTTTGALADRVSRTLPATASTTGALADQAGKTLPSAVTTTASSSSRAAKTLAATVTTAGALARALARVLTATVTATGSLTRALARLLTGGVTATGTASGQPEKTLPATVTTTGALGPRTVARKLTATVTTAASIVVGFLYQRVFPATVATAATFGRGFFATFSRAVSTASSLLTVIFRQPSPIQPVVTITPANPAVVTVSPAVQAVVTTSPAGQAVVTIGTPGFAGAAFHPAAPGPLTSSGAAAFHPADPAVFTVTQ